VKRQELILPADERAARLARSVLADAIPPALDSRIEDARLAVTEIATNAVRHGRLRPEQDTLRLVIEVDDDHVRIELEQPTETDGLRLVEPRLAGPPPEGGYGLRLVEQTADEWGFAPGPPGYVWFEFRR
jgi:anti-sigma regulatory factor (Ser/Thr protein kinase)